MSRATFLPVRIAYYDAERGPLKVGRFSDVRIVNRIPTLFAVEMHNFQTDHRTRLNGAGGGL